MAAIHGNPAMLRAFSLSFIYLLVGWRGQQCLARTQGSLPVAFLNGINYRLVQIQFYHFVLCNRGKVGVVHRME
jgi:hypothetical protein